MIMKMTQDLGNRMEKMQEMFTKDLQELMNKETEVNNTLERIHSRITEADQINGQEGRMVEITVTEQNIEKGMKKMMTAQDSSGATLSAPTFTLQGSQVEKTEKELEKIFAEIIAENFLNMGKESQPSQEAQSCRKDKAKQEHMKTHRNQTEKKNYRDKTLKTIKEK